MTTNETRDQIECLQRLLDDALAKLAEADATIKIMYEASDGTERAVLNKLGRVRAALDRHRVRQEKLANAQ